ncbi:MAG TPA: CBS domain-containing protein [Flavipsychrobacter sp.]
MKKKKPVADIMTTDVHTADVDKDTLFDVKDLMLAKGLRHVPVVHGKKLVGIISKTDIDRLIFSRMFEEEEDADEAVLEMLKIEQVMTHKPKAVSEDTTVREVAEILAKEEFHALPVVDGDKLVGIVTTTDVIKYMLTQY